MNQVESSHHIIFDCEVTATLWEWLSKGVDLSLDLSSCQSLIMGVIGHGITMVQHVINSAIVHIILAIWIEINQKRFHNMHKSMTTLFNCILAEVKLSYTLVLAQGNSDMKDYKISRLFNILLRTKRIYVCKDIHWCPRTGGVIKFNCDGSSIGVQSNGAIGIVIRSSTSFLGAIASNIGYATTLEAEFSACMRAIEKAKDMNLTDICLETDSIRVVNAYKKQIGVPWQMRARWYVQLYQIL